jgi:hypothetical protein
VAVKREVSKRELGVSTVKAAPNKRTHSGEEFRQNEGLGEIVVRSRVQTFHSLLDQSAGGEHQHRSFDAPLAQLAANLKAAEVRQPDIEKDGVVGDIRAELKRLCTRFGHIHGVGIFSQCSRNEACDFPFVFDQKDPHRFV